MAQTRLPQIAMNSIGITRYCLPPNTANAIGVAGQQQTNAPQPQSPIYPNAMAIRDAYRVGALSHQDLRQLAQEHPTLKPVVDAIRRHPAI